MVRFYLSSILREAKEGEVEYLSEQIERLDDIEGEDLKSLKHFSEFFYNNFQQCEICQWYEHKRNLNDEGFCYDCDTFLKMEGA